MTFLIRKTIFVSTIRATSHTFYHPTTVSMPFTFITNVMLQNLNFKILILEQVATKHVVIQQILVANQKIFYLNQGIEPAIIIFVGG